MIIKKNSGLTMIEVLISIVILSVGLLGIAALQVMGMVNTNSANLRSQATFLAAEYGDIVRGNLKKTDKEANNNTFGTATDDGAEFTSAAPGAATPGCSTTAGCSATQMAQTARFFWATNVPALLPDGVATSNRIGNNYTVTITWTDDKEDIDNDTNTTVSFATSFRP